MSIVTQFPILSYYYRSWYFFILWYFSSYKVANNLNNLETLPSKNLLCQILNSFINLGSLVMVCVSVRQELVTSSSSKSSVFLLQVRARLSTALAHSDYV